MGTEKSTLAIEIGRRIAERRKQLGLTQAQAAEKAGSGIFRWVCVLAVLNGWLI